MSAELTAAGKKVWNKVVAKAWADADYKKRLLADPAGVLREEGLTTAPKPQLRIVENTDDVVYLVLPSQQLEELSEADLDTIAAGKAGVAWSCYADRGGSSTAK